MTFELGTCVQSFVSMRKDGVLQCQEWEASIGNSYYMSTKEFHAEWPKNSTNSMLTYLAT